MPTTRKRSRYFTKDFEELPSGASPSSAAPARSTAPTPSSASSLSGEGLDGVELSSSAGNHDTYTGRISYGDTFRNGLDVVLSGSLFTGADPSPARDPLPIIPTTKDRKAE